MGIWEIVVGAVVLLLSVIMIIVIILQEGHQAGLGTVTGGADSFFGKGKARTADAMFAKATKYITIGFFIIVILLNALSFFGLTGKAKNNPVPQTSQSSTVVETSKESSKESSATETSKESSKESSTTETSKESSKESSTTETSKETSTVEASKE